jgi:hypothetical protein
MAVLLVIPLFGIVEASFLLKDWLSVSSAARAGARMGASQPRMEFFARDSADQVTNAISGLDPTRVQEVWVYKADPATGLPLSGATCPANCVKYAWNSGLKKLDWIPGTTWGYQTQNACAGDLGPAPPLRDSLGVYVKYKHLAPLGWFFNNAIVSESTVMWLEPSFALVCKP